MRYSLIVLFSLIVLSACQARTLKATRTPSLAPTRRATDTTPAASPLPSLLFFEGFHMADANSGWAFRGVSQLYRTDDGGTTWHEIHLQGKMQVAGAAFLNGQEAWLLGFPEADLRVAVYHTADGGQTWTQLAGLRGSNLSLYFHDAKVGWATNVIGAAGNAYYQVYQTEDGGQTWGRLPVTSPYGGSQGAQADSIHVTSQDSVSFQPPSTLWVTSGYGISTPYAGLAVSRDGGQSWEELNPPLPADQLIGQPPVAAEAPQFVSSREAYLPVTIGEHLVFLVSSDGGNHWALLRPVLPAKQMAPRVQFVNAEDGFAVCGSYLCSTQDGAKSWSQIPSPFPFDGSAGGSYASQFEFVAKETGWAILSNNGSPTAFLKTTDGGRTWIDIEPRAGF